MLNKEILIKVIQKAIKNGFDFDIYWQLDPINMTISSNRYDKEICWERVIFSHEFAKAFWGENILSEIRQHPIVEQDGKEIIVDKPILALTILLPSWQFHLQQMVLEIEPLKYLEQFLEQ